MKKITIITATFNAESVLERLIQSIALQKTEEIEFIIIDGGSKDGTLDIVDRHKLLIDTFISEPDRGIYDAWNKGIKMATGEWIMFLGADDLLLSGALNYYLKLISENDLFAYDFISAQNEYVDKNGAILKILGNGANWAHMKKGMSAAHVGSLHNKKNLFEKVGLYNLKFRICGDYELLLRKGSLLKSYFMKERIAQMGLGGVSFSVKAIIESYKIRNEHHTVNTFYNLILFMRDYIAHKLFRLRKLV